MCTIPSSTASGGLPLICVHHEEVCCNLEMDNLEMCDNGGSRRQHAHHHVPKVVLSRTEVSPSCSTMTWELNNDFGDSPRDLLMDKLASADQGITNTWELNHDFGDSTCDLFLDNLASPGQGTTMTSELKNDFDDNPRVLLLCDKLASTDQVITNTWELNHDFGDSPCELLLDKLISTDQGTTMAQDLNNDVGANPRVLLFDHRASADQGNFADKPRTEQHTHTHTL
eukprot:TRINITY_DN25986_c0_g1_i1.p1 TRINITY_DN25986_c0_g1~~TRINITY_DN25986_c0_g1_i1.p1  ORF type:complete len:227 (+),score=22.25 TRINITY_DN25986_c0_g1_i1:59-739(+)